MVVNIIYHFDTGREYSTFVGIDGNGVEVISGSFSWVRDYDKDEISWEGEYNCGRANGKIAKVLSVDEFYSDAKGYDYKFLFELLSDEKSILINKIIEL